MDTLEQLRHSYAAELEAAQARQDAVGHVGEVIEALKERGFTPKLDITDAGMVRLEFDPLQVGMPQMRQLPPPTAPVVKEQAEAPAPDLAPEDVPEPAAAAVAEPAPSQPVAKDLKTGAYSVEELATIRKMLREGADRDEIAALLCRDKRGVANAINRVKAAQTAGRRARKPEPEAASTTPPKVETRADTPPPPRAAAPAPTAAPPFETGIPYAERHCRTHLEAVGWPGRWTPHLDLTLVEGLARGDGIGNAAQACDVDREIALDRWRRINPDPTIESQQVLLKVLRRMTEENV